MCKCANVQVSSIQYSGSSTNVNCVTICYNNAMDNRSKSKARVYAVALCLCAAFCVNVGLMILAPFLGVARMPMLHALSVLLALAASRHFWQNHHVRLCLRHGAGVKITKPPETCRRREAPKAG